MEKKKKMMVDHKLQTSTIKNMYSKEFCDIYNKYGWDYFSETMGKAILQYIHLNKIHIVNHLDLACGTGTLCNYFYHHNFKTMGIDISEDMIDICKSKNNKIYFLVADMITYNPNEKYDLVTITCDAINHILENKKVEQLFFNVYDMLNNGGYFIFDIYDADKLELNTNIVSNRDNEIKVNYYITERKNLINTNIKVMQNSNLVYEYNVLEKLYDIEYIKNLLFKCNFKIIKIADKILDENQRFKDKIYIICKK